MNSISPFVAGVCLLLNACAGSSGTQGNTNANGGSAGNEPPAGGSSNSAGAVDQGGGSNSDAEGGAAAGTDPDGGLGESAGAEAGGQSGGPSMSIDYAIWQLQLPTGSGHSPTTIPPQKLLMGYQDAYFYAAPDNGQMFMDPPTGITTSGSTRCRTELRESLETGAAASWHSTGTNTMTVTGKIVKGSNVTVAQVFDSGGGNTLCELQYNGSGFSVFYEESKGSGSLTPLNTSLALNTSYTFVLSLSSGVLTVTIDGKQLYSHMPSSGTLASTFYFKVGN
jgi:hypothetical protein